MCASVLKTTFDHNSKLLSDFHSHAVELKLLQAFAFNVQMLHIFDCISTD